MLVEYQAPESQQRCYYFRYLAWLPSRAAPPSPPLMAIRAAMGCALSRSNVTSRTAGMPQLDIAERLEPNTNACGSLDLRPRDVAWGSF